MVLSVFWVRSFITVESHLGQILLLNSHLQWVNAPFKPVGPPNWAVARASHLPCSVQWSACSGGIGRRRNCLKRGQNQQAASCGLHKIRIRQSQNQTECVKRLKDAVLYSMSCDICLNAIALFNGLVFNGSIYSKQRNHVETKTFLLRGGCPTRVQPYINWILPEKETSFAAHVNWVWTWNRCPRTGIYGLCT